MVLNAVGTVVPFASATATCTVAAWPATKLVGKVLKTSFAAAPTDEATLNVPLVAPVNPGEAAVSVYPVPAALSARSEKLATPLEALTVLVPLNVALPGLVPMATVTTFVAVATRWPDESTIDACVPGVSVTLLSPPEGKALKASLLGAPGPTLNRLV